MIICLSSGGLANQLFQFAFSNAVKRFEGEKLLFDKTQLTIATVLGNTKRKFELGVMANISVLKYCPYFWIIASFLDRLGIQTNYVWQVNQLHRPNEFRAFLILQGVALEGDILISELQKRSLYYYNIVENSSSSRAKDYITSLEFKNNCSIHVRRGDYISNAEANEFHGFVGLQYYLEAINYMRNEIPDVEFYVFSDDLDWVQKVFTTQLGVFHFPEKEQEFSGRDSLFVLSNFQNQILANSSFSLWAAYMASFECGKGLKIQPREWWKGEIRQKGFVKEWIVL